MSREYVRSKHVIKILNIVSNTIMMTYGHLIPFDLPYGYLKPLSLNLLRTVFTVLPEYSVGISVG